MMPESSPRPGASDSPRLSWPVGRRPARSAPPIRPRTQQGTRRRSLVPGPAAGSRVRVLVTRPQCCRLESSRTRPRPGGSPLGVTGFPAAAGTPAAGTLGCRRRRVRSIDHVCCTVT
eukprot:759374-Hanusia_phi.AAC.1